MSRVLINLSNLHAGGGLQVGISFVHDLIHNVSIYDDLSDFDVLISSEIYDYFSSSLLLNCNLNLVKYDTFGISSMFDLKFNKLLFDYDIVFTLFGPLYSFVNFFYELTGFAQPWILNSSKELRSSLSFFNKFKFFIQSLFFSRANSLVVELEHVLHDMPNFIKSNKQNFVVYNSISTVFVEKDNWSQINIPHKSSLKIGYLTRDYPHKNIGILSDVAKILEFNYGIIVHFYFSLRDDEWLNYSDKFGSYATSVGPLKLNECPSFYNAMDAMIFPSLLECFSASPLEALFMKKPLFASDRGFIKDTCADYAIYFDPLDPHDIARVIFNYVKDSRCLPFTEMHFHAKNFSSSIGRTNSYINIIRQLRNDIQR